MKSFNRIFTAIIFVLILIFVVFHLCLTNIVSDSGRQYQPHCYTISSSGLESVHLSDYNTITAVIPMDENHKERFLKQRVIMLFVK